MKPKIKEKFTDEFVSIYELRNGNRSKIQRNYFRETQINDQIEYDLQKPFFSSRWEKLKTYLIDLSENLIFEPDDESHAITNLNNDNKNLLLAIDSEQGNEYMAVNIARICSDVRMYSVLNFILNLLEQFLRNIQIGFILDAETLEFNQNTCTNHIKMQLPRVKRIMLVSRTQELVFKTVTKLKKCFKKTFNLFLIPTQLLKMNPNHRGQNGDQSLFQNHGKLKNISNAP